MGHIVFAVITGERNLDGLEGVNEMDIAFALQDAVGHIVTVRGFGECTGIREFALLIAGSDALAFYPGEETGIIPKPVGVAMLCLVVLELAGENGVNTGRHNNVCELTGPADIALSSVLASVYSW